MPITRDALILMDFHHRIVADAGAAGQSALDRAAQALGIARDHGVAVFHVIPHYRPGYPELPSRPVFDAVKQYALFAEPDRSDGFAPPVSPATDEPICAKSRYSPFRGNDLTGMLQVGGYRRLFLCGISTSGVVLSAVREAWDADFELVVLADACSDPDPEVHDLLVRKILPPQAEIIRVDGFAARLANGGDQALIKPLA